MMRDKKKKVFIEFDALNRFLLIQQTMCEETHHGHHQC